MNKVFSTFKILYISPNTALQVFTNQYARSTTPSSPQSGWYQISNGTSVPHERSCSHNFSSETIWHDKKREKSKFQMRLSIAIYTPHLHRIYKNIDVVILDRIIYISLSYIISTDSSFAFNYYYLHSILLNWCYIVGSWSLHLSCHEGGLQNLCQGCSEYPRSDEKIWL